MRVLTAADSNFFHCLKGLAKSVLKYYGKPLIVYDLGLTDEQKNQIDAEVRSLEINVDYFGYTTHKNTDFIKTTHKPFCIKHYFENDTEPLIYADADCLFLQKVELEGFDVGVTVKPRRKVDTSNFFNGIINAGVIFFLKYPERLIEEWIEGCTKSDVTDQMVLAELLSQTMNWKKINQVQDWHGYNIKPLKIEDYNDYYLKTGKIFHFKGERHDGEIYQKLITAIDENKDPYSVFRGQAKSRKLELLRKVKDNIKYISKF